MELHCVKCDPTGRGRYCARKRCYCGHPECWAYDSWQEPAPLPDVVVKRYLTESKTAPGSSAWDERTETSWLEMD